MLEKFRGLKWAAGKPPGNASGSGDDAADNATPVSDNSAELLAMLQNPAEKIRLKAVVEIEDPALLLQLSTNDDSAKVQLAAARQYTRFLADSADSLTLLSGFASQPQQQLLAKTITGYSPHTRLREHGSTLFDNEQDLADIAINTRFHDTRINAINRIRSIDQIDRCWRQVKTKDKIAARELKSRLDNHHSAQKLSLEREQTVDKLLESMQTLSTSVWSPHYANTYAQLHARRQQLDFTPSSEFTAAFNAAETIARQKVEENAQRQQLHDARTQWLEQLDTLTTSLASSHSEQLPEAIASSSAAADAIGREWQAAEPRSAADTAQRQRYDAARNRFTQLLDAARAVAQATDTESGNAAAHPEKHLATLEKARSQLAALDTQPTFAAPLAELINAARQQIDQHKRESEQLRQSVFKQLGALQGAINNNRWGPAKSIHQRLERKIARLHGRDRQIQQEKLDRLGKQLHDLGDWNEFASLPKLQELCEQIEALPAAGMAPRDQADRIKQLQQQWKSMGASPAQQELWPRFKKAADTAYEPCARYFAAKREEKQAKLDVRSNICDMLQKYIDTSDWQNPDWRLVEKTIRTARSEWRNNRIFDRKASKPLDNRFDSLLKTLQDKLEPVYEANAAEKSALIEKVKQLGEGEINQHCINQVKRLQSVWKTGGVMRRKTDQALWKEFNEACGAIFNTHRSQQREQYKSSIEHVTRARAIIGELKQIAKGATIDDKQLQALQDEFDQLPEFPERDARYIKRDMTRAVEAVEKSRQNASDSSRRAEMARLYHKAELCARLEALAGQPVADVEADLAAILDEWQDGEKPDKSEWRKAINLRRDSIVSHLQNGSLPDYENNTAQRRLLCIELEILLDRDTPAEDKTLRMQHQLQQLQQGMTSNATVSKAAQLAEIEIRWLCAFPADPATRDALSERFNSTLQKRR